MKLIIRIFAAALLAGALTACTGSRTDSDDNGLTARQKIMLKSLEMEVDKVNKELPLDTGEGLTLTGMAIEDGYLVSTCTYTEGSQLEIDHSDENKAAIIEAAGTSATSRLKELGMGLKYVYVEESTGATDSITIAPEEM